MENSEPVIDSEEWKRTLNSLREKIHTNSLNPMLKKQKEEKRYLGATQRMQVCHSAHPKPSIMTAEELIQVNSARSSMAPPLDNNRRKYSLEPRVKRKHIKEESADRTHNLKQALNIMQRENDKLKVKLQHSENETAKKNKKIKELSLPHSVSTPSSHFESSLVNALKGKLKESEIEIEKCNNKIRVLERNIKITKVNEQDTTLSEYELECRRLREMLRSLIKSKHEGRPDCYEEMERKLLSSQIRVSELQQLNQDLNEKLLLQEKSLKENIDNLKMKFKELEQDLQKQRTINKKNKETISKLKEDSKKLTEENKLLQDLKNESYETPPDQNSPKNVGYNETDKNEEIERLQNKLRDLQERQNHWDEKFQDKDRELRELKSNYKQMEDSHILQHYEDEEKYTQKIVRLERQLECIKKELALTQKKEEVENKPSGYSIEVPKKETYLYIVEEDSIEYAKQTLKNAFLLHYKGMDKFKKKFYHDYATEEKITIKELSKMFQRKPIKMLKKDAELLARYLIEPRDAINVAYNAYLESTMIEARMKLDNFLRIDYPADYFKLLGKTEKSICLKLKERLPALREALLEVEPGFIDVIDLKKFRKASFKIFYGMSSLEQDYAIALMKGEDMHHLNAGKLLEKIENYVPELAQTPESSPKYKKEEKLELDPETEQVVIEIGKYLQSHNLKLKELFKHSLYHSVTSINGKYPFLINSKDFFSLLQTQKVAETVPPKFHEYCAVSAEESNIFNFTLLKRMINPYI